MQSTDHNASLDGNKTIMEYNAPAQSIIFEYNTLHVYGHLSMNYIA